MAKLVIYNGNPGCGKYIEIKHNAEFLKVVKLDGDKQTPLFVGPKFNSNLFNRSNIEEDDSSILNIYNLNA